VPGRVATHLRRMVRNDHTLEPVLLEDLEDDLVLLERAEVLDAPFLGHLAQLGHRERLQPGDVDRLARPDQSLKNPTDV